MKTAARIAWTAALGTVVGALASLAAIGFVDLVALLNEWLLISPRSRFMAEDTGWLALATICVPALGGLIVGVVHRYVPERRPHGPPDVIRAVQGLDGRIPPRAGFLSALTSLVSLGAGASVGQYGPLVHLGATLGSLAARISPPNRWMIAVGVGCGVASAISTAFNAPIAGVIFAHEVILRHYSLRAFAPVTVAAAVGHVIANVVFERPPLFRVEAVSVSHAPEFLGFMLIGVCGAFVAVLYMRAILQSGRLARSLPVAEYLKPMLAGAVLGVAALWIPDVLGIGRETLRFAVIDHAFAPGELALLLAAKVLATALCIGFGFAGGVFSPALLAGILFGALAGSGAEWLLGDLRSDVAIYAVCGMVAVTSAVIGAPLTTILIVFELTRNYDLATAAMVSVVFSNLVSYRIFGRSLFDVQLRLRGFDLSLGREKVVLDQRRIEDYVSADYVALAPDAPLAEAKSRLLEAGRHEGHVLDAAGVWLGSLRLEEILAYESAGASAGAGVAAAGPGGGAGIGAGIGANAGPGPAAPESAAAPESPGVHTGVDAADAASAGGGRTPAAATAALLAKRRPPVFTVRTSIRAAMERMGDFVGESIPVLEEESEEGEEEDGGGRLVGVVFEAAIVRAYLDTMNDLRREENAAA